jgi:dTMP kinase
VVEGLDGAGTTTVAGALVEALQGRGLRVRATAEPTGGAFGALLRRHLTGEITLAPTTTALVFTADREDHLQSVVRPALARGRWVVSDRYLLSTLAYQGAEGVDRDMILGASSAFEVPDVTFVLEAPEDVRRSRMAGRGRLERYEDPESARRIASSYAESVALLRSAGQHIEAIDATPAVGDVVAEALRRLDAVT